MLPLHLERRRFLSIDLDLEQLYNQIISQKKKLQPTNLEEEEFLASFPPKLLRKAAHTLTANSDISAYRFVRGYISLEINKDPKTQLVRVKLQTITQ